MAVKEKITIENAKITFKNFSGKETEFNSAGSRNFAVILSDDDAKELADRGWNVRVREPKEGYEDQGNFNTLRVNLRYSENAAINPKVFRISNGRMIQLSENSVGTLDYADIENVDLIIRPYNWTKANRSGTSAYVEEMYVTVKDNPLAEKYQRYEDNFTDPEELPFE